MREEVENGRRGHRDETAWWLLAALALALILAFLLRATHPHLPNPSRNAEALGAHTGATESPR